MDPDAVWLLFLGPIGFLGAGAFVYWFTARADRAAERRRNRLPPRETGKPV